MATATDTQTMRVSHQVKRTWSAGRFTRTAIPHIVLALLSLTAVIPFIWMVMASFKEYKELVEGKQFLPVAWTLKNYGEIMFRVNFLSAFRNSVVTAVSVTAVAIFTSSALGYIFSKYHFWGKETLFTVILATMMVPFSVVLVPLYVTIGRMGMVNQLSGIIVTGFWSTFGIFMMRQFMETIPSELIDAARIDGASEQRIFLTIVIPMATAPMAALGIFTFLGNWDSFLWPMVVLNTPDRQTLPLVLSGLRNLFMTRYDLWAAGSMLTVVPIMTIYAFSSKWFIRGIAMTGMKA
jgi:multiple sugar transport system permease protein